MRFYLAVIIFILIYSCNSPINLKNAQNIRYTELSGFELQTIPLEVETLHIDNWDQFNAEIKSIDDSNYNNLQHQIHFNKQSVALIKLNHSDSSRHIFVDMTFSKNDTLHVYFSVINDLPKSDSLVKPYKALLLANKYKHIQFFKN